MIKPPNILLISTLMYGKPYAMTLGVPLTDSWFGCNWDIHTTLVAMRLSTGTNRPVSGRVWMDNVRCSENDLRLHDCSFPA